MPFNPFMQGMGRTADLRSNRLHRRPGRGILAAVFLHHAHRAFANFRGIFGCFSFVHHGSILLEKGASSKSGAVQTARTRNTLRQARQIPWALLALFPKGVFLFRVTPVTFHQSPFWRAKNPDSSYLRHGQTTPESHQHPPTQPSV